MSNLKNKIIEQLENLNDSDLIEVNNVFCQLNNYDNEIYYNDEEFFNTFFDGRVLEAVRAISYGEYNYNDEFVVFNGYGNLESFICIDEDKLQTSFEELADFIINNEKEFKHIIDFEE